MALSIAIIRFIGKRNIKPRICVNGLRYMSGIRPECEPPKQIKDCEKLKLRTSICDEESMKRPPMNNLPKVPFKSMWENPLCKAEPCPDPPPKFDSIYYVPSDKFCRKYQQTWNECPPRRIVQKILCEFPKEKMPPFEKRPRQCRPPTAKSHTDSGDLMDCRKKQNNRCVKIRMPGCKRLRDSVKCHKDRSMADCVKIKCPYPSFTECKRPPFNKIRPHECDCLRQKSQCEEYLIYLKKRAYKAKAI